MPGARRKDPAQHSSARVKDEGYYRRACALIDDLFGAQLVADMPADVRAAFDRIKARR